MSKFKYIIAYFLVILSSSVFAQNNIEVGDRAPEITITDYIQNEPQDKSFENKYILLEFWATWCAPCLGAVPHLNELQEKYKSRNDVLILSMTYEEVDKVLKTLNRIAFKTTVVSDQDRRTLKNYGVENELGSISVPKTILIDNEGIIRWIGYPNHLTDEMFEDFVNGKELKSISKLESPKADPVSEPSKKEDMIENAERMMKDKNTKYMFLLIESEDRMEISKSMKSPLRGKYLDVNNTCQAILADLSSVSKKQILIPDSINARTYSLFYKSDKPGNADDCIESIKLNLLKTLNLKEKKVKKMIDVYQLFLVDKNNLEVSDDTTGITHSGINNTHLLFSNASMDALVKTLSSYYQIVVENKTGLKENFNFLIRNNSLENTIEDLKTYGLVLKKNSQDLDFYIYN